MREEDSMLTHLSLFTGIGGIDLAAEWAGFKTVGQVEIDEFATKVLEKHWPNVPKWGDIREFTAEEFYNKTGLRTVDLISGGFPCQPFSVAGKQKGKRDERYLWPEMLRVIREIKPTWVLAENVPGILRIAGKTVCEDLEREGYAVAIFDFEAAAVGAPHRRERVFFVAHTRCPLRQRTVLEKENEDEIGERFANITERPSCTPPFVADTTGEGLEGAKWQELERTGKRFADGSWWAVEPRLGGMVDGLSYWLHEYWRVEPDIPRVANGIPNRIHRLKCLGNAVVPQQVYPILLAIAKIEKEGDEVIARTQ